MVNLESLAEISSRQIEAMLSQTDDENERKIISSQFFGGVHVLFTGDFYQLKLIHGDAMYTENPKNMNMKYRINDHQIQNRNRRHDIH